MQDYTGVQGLERGSLGVGSVYEGGWESDPCGVAERAFEEFDYYGGMGDPAVVGRAESEDSDSERDVGQLARVFAVDTDVPCPRWPASEILWPVYLEPLEPGRDYDSPEDEGGDGSDDSDDGS